MGSDSSQALGDFGIGSMPIVGSAIGGQQAARAAGKAAEATMQQQVADRQQALGLAGPSPMEMQQLEQAINMNTADINRKQKLLDSSDPALIEAGHQALALLQGKEAGTLDPIRKQRQLERDTLSQRLQSQLGSGWETSTAGQQALNKFDQATDSVLAQTQQQSLGQLLGVAQNVQSYGSLQPNIANSSGLASQRGSINSRQISALQGNRIDASLPFVQDIARGKNIQQQSNDNTKLITTVGGMLAGGA